MFDSIKRDVLQSFRSGNMITRLILINCAIFIVVVLVKVFNFDWQQQTNGRFYTWLVDENLALSTNLMEVLFHPWTFLTHMFLHEGAWHLFWNMLWLYWMGRILGDLLGDKKVLPIYIMGGLFGALCMLLFGSVFPNVVGPRALGASAAVSAITLAAATTSPDYSMRFIIIGSVKLKYIALALIVIDLLQSTISNTGGHMAHLGGALFGYLAVTSMRRGYSLTAPLENLLGKRGVKKKKAKMTVAHRSNLLTEKEKKAAKPQRKPKAETDVDKILEKIKATGIDSLSEREKQILDQASKK